MESWVAEIKIRAARRIGQISKGLEKVVTTGGGNVGIPSSGKPKSETLKQAGLSTSAANRFEKIADIPEFEQCTQLARRKAIYLEIYPETGRGGERGNQHTGGKSRQSDTMSFSQDT